MKKLMIFLLAAILTFPVTFAAPYGAGTLPPRPAETKESAEAKALISRLHEIKAMDKKKLTSAEKKKLHKEVKTISKRLKDLDSKFYISTVALILIVVLLIVLLA